MQIEVTAKDIEDGVRKDETRCPIALAVRRVLPDADISIGYDVITIDGTDYWTDKILGNFEQTFDKGEHVEPFVFDLDSLQEKITICCLCQHSGDSHQPTYTFIEGVMQYTCTCGSKCSGTEFKYKGT